MGSFLSGNPPPQSDSDKNHHPYQSERQDAAKVSLTRPNRPPPRPQTTERLLDHLDKRLTGYTATIRTMKGNKSPDTQQQLLKMMSETERELHTLNREMQQQMGEKEDTLQTVLSANDLLIKENKLLKEELTKEQNRTKELYEEKTELLSRLSKVAGDRLVENNPAITDLSDQKRPTKLGEIHSELYDNEWTDAFEALKDQQYEEDYAINTLYLTLVDVFEFCKRKSESLLTNTEDAVNFLFEEYDLLQKQENKPQHMTKSTGRDKPRHLTIPTGRVTSKDLPSCLQLQQRWISKLKKDDAQKRCTMKVEKSDVVSSKVKKLQKEIAESMAQVVQKAYMKSRWIDGQFVPELKPYIKKCVFLCWMMVVQSPSMSFHIVDVNKDAKFETNLYKAYTANGSLIKFVVWPALLLHEDGPVVGKGVVQGCNCY